MNKIFRLTREGKKFVRVPLAERSFLLDHLYEFKTASLDELTTIDKEAREKLQAYKRSGYVEEISDN